MKPNYPLGEFVSDYTGWVMQNSSLPKEADAAFRLATINQFFRERYPDKDVFDFRLQKMICALEVLYNSRDALERAGLLTNQLAKYGLPIENTVIFAIHKMVVDEGMSALTIEQVIACAKSWGSREA